MEFQKIEICFYPNRRINERLRDQTQRTNYVTDLIDRTAQMERTRAKEMKCGEKISASGDQENPKENGRSQTR